MELWKQHCTGGGALLARSMEVLQQAAAAAGEGPLGAAAEGLVINALAALAMGAQGGEEGAAAVVAGQAGA